MQRDLGLVHRHHVTSLVDLKESEPRVSPLTSDNLLLAIVRHRPGLVLGSLEPLLAVPVQLQCPRFVSHPVANEINVASINNGTDAIFEQRGDLVLLRNHPIRVESSIYTKVAFTPSLLHAKRFRDS